MTVMIMSTHKEQAQTRRKQLLAARTECLAKMSPCGRRAYEKRQRQRGVESAADCRIGLAQEIKELVAEAHRLRQNAETKNDVRAALRGLDTALRALLLYGKATGEIATTRRTASPSALVVPSRDKGIQTATELLLALCTPDELSGAIARLEQRRLELASAPLPLTSVTTNHTQGGASAAPPETTELEDATIPDSEEFSLDPDLQ